jgi:predicted phosphodiesterase
MTTQDRMEKAYEANPKIGRVQLSRLCGVTDHAARAFLGGKFHTGPDLDTVVIPAVNIEPPTLAEVLSFGGHLSKHEQDILLKSMKMAPAEIERKSYTWGQDSFKFAVVSDTHIGHKKALISWWQRAMDHIDKEKCAFILHPGDISEGMSGRPGHAFELDAIGITAQLQMTEDRFKLAPVKIRGITGNHDQWAHKTIGIDFGIELQNKIPDHFENLGMDEKTITIDGVDIMLWHGGDGASYALSYRVQKFIEGLSGGEKPHILLSGHAHKSIGFMCRNVMAFECGTLCGQTAWMRGKKLAAHVGFWIIEVWPAPGGGIERIKQEWIPFFTEGD